MKAKISTIILLLVLSLQFTLAQDFNRLKMDSLFNILAEKQKAMGSVTISKNNAGLTAQATGQSAFPLEATGKDEFRFDQAGIKMEFNTDKNEMTLYQGGGTFVFTREK